jgi:hypothetical protein
MKKNEKMENKTGKTENRRTSLSIVTEVIQLLFANLTGTEYESQKN